MKPSDIRFLSEYASAPHLIGQVYFSDNLPSPPETAVQVHFQRLDIVVDGKLLIETGSDTGQHTRFHLNQGDILYTPANCWSIALPKKPVTILSVQVGKQSFGLTMKLWDGEQFSDLQDIHILRRGPRTGTFILQSIEELHWHQKDQSTLRLLFSSLFSHILDLYLNPPDTLSRGKALFEAVRDYLEQHYHTPLTREAVAQHFYVSPGYLSQLFQKEGKLKFNEYLTHIRLERAKYLLKEYDMTVKEVAHRCGFNDSNYFCRVFRNQTARSPSEYRTQYRSHL
ncbi:AraC family transcriptional regulator [Vibrio albus]|uniref:AraC family transcriptional regulator n=1 Tax=Vibrio albus TaxID=2200953 RepID=A0A2U3B5M0_9VIBR|nr:AraC family transcriptional regulator [Vibrio albus]PWI32077.1 AraC family transcriptional regulator [Vibrio albus]